MSSLIIIQQSDAVHIITDGAYYDGDGLVQAIGPKVRELPASRCIFAIRGASYPDAPLTLALSLLPNFDSIMETLPNILAAFVATAELAAGETAQPVQRHFELSVAGWSDEVGGWAAGIASTFEPRDIHDPQGLSYFDGYQRFVPFLAAPACCAPQVDLLGVLGRAILTQADVDGLDPVRDGMTMHAAQRLTPGLTIDRQVQYLVGGQAELVTVSDAGISRRVLCDWPDEVGAFIVPAGAEPIEDVRGRLELQTA